MEDFYKKSCQLFLSISVLAIFHLLYNIVKHHIYIGADGSVYLEVARHLDKGEGFFYWMNGVRVPYIFWPPLYPVLLYLTGKLTGPDLFWQAGLISLAGTVTVLAALCRIFRFYRLRLRYQILGYLIFTGSWIYFLMFNVLSETVYLPLWLWMMYFLLVWTGEGKKSHLFIAGLLAGLLLLTKYAAFGLIGAAVIWILLVDKTGWKSRFYNLSVFLLPVLILFLPWYFYTFSQGRAAMFGREISRHFPGLVHWKAFGITLANWTVPGLTRYLIGPVVLIFAWLLLKKHKQSILLLNTSDRLIWLWTALFFFGFILLSVSVADYDIPLDNRILSPLYFSLFILFLLWMQKLPDSYAKYALVILISLGSIAGFAEKNTAFGSIKNDYEKYRGTPVIHAIRQGHFTRIWCNISDVLKVYVPDGKIVYDFPVKYDRKSLKINMKYEEQMRQIRRKLDSENVALVYFYGYEQRPFMPDHKDLMRFFVGYPILQFPQGFIILSKKNNLTRKQPDAYSLD